MRPSSAIDRLRRDVAARNRAASEALAQRDAVAAELFGLAHRAGGPIVEDARTAELAAQRDALALELFRLARRTAPSRLRRALRRLLPAPLRRPL